MEKGRRSSSPRVNRSRSNQSFASRKPPTPPPKNSVAKNVATTAAGVAGGIVAGHALTQMLFGNNEGSSAPCRRELNDFLDCADENVSDLRNCTRLFEVLKNCSIRN